MKPSWMPKASSRIFAIGARQFVVQEAFETMRCSLRSASSFTPTTTIASISSFGGTVRTTLFAPASRCFCSFSRVTSFPVASTTTSTPSFPQGSFAGSFSAVMRTRRPSTVMASPSTRTSFSKTPITVSYFRR